jgi:hypothetical protein
LLARRAGDAAIAAERYRTLPAAILSRSHEERGNDNQFTLSPFSFPHSSLKLHGRAWMPATPVGNRHR